MIDKNKWYSVNEKSRIYDWADGSMTVFHDITRIMVSNSGTHYLETNHGSRKHIIQPGWRTITLQGEWIKA